MNRTVLLAACLWLVLTACSKSEAPTAPEAAKPAPAPVLHIVKEQFEVGAHAYVRSLSTEADDLFVGTSTGVLQVNRKTGDMVRTFSTDDGMRNNYAFIVRPGPDDRLWMGTNGGGLSVHTDGAIRNYFPKHGLADIWVYDVAFEPDGTVWLATWDGLNRITGPLDDKSSWTTFNVADGLANPWVYAIQIAEDGSRWFGTEGGLSRLKDGVWTTWLHKDGMGGDNPKALKRSDKSGFGSTREGEHSHDLTTLDETGNETYNANYVFSLKLDTDGDLWIGTWGGGVSRFDGVTFTNFTEADGLSGNVVYAIDQAPDGALWFGTNHGVSRYDGVRWQTYNRANGLIGEDIYSLKVDADHTVWVGQKGGVSRMIPMPHAS
ncbi:MAG: two-component regulator propeller domain-containing protein [Leptospirillia bacterium]